MCKNTKNTEGLGEKQGADPCALNFSNINPEAIFFWSGGSQGNLTQQPLPYLSLAGFAGLSASEKKEPGMLMSLYKWWQLVVFLEGGWREDCFAAPFFLMH